MTKILVFGSRSLTARHLPAMRWHMLAAASYTWTYRGTEEVVSPIPLGWIGPELRAREEDMRFHSALTLIHGDGPPGKVPGCVGADRLSEIAASLEWPETRRVRRFPPEPMAGETWAAAAGRRNREMVDARPDFAICFHADPNLGRGSAITARLLTEAKIRWRLVLMKANGEIVKIEDRT